MREMRLIFIFPEKIETGIIQRINLSQSVDR